MQKHKPIRLSYSGMGEMACPFRFKVLRIDKSHKEPDTEPLVVGRDTAEFLAQYREHCLKAGERSDLQFLRALGEKAEGRAKDMLRAMENCAFLTLPENPTWYGVEYRMAFRRDWSATSWGDWDNSAFLGVVDFVYVLGDHLYIIDDKTGRAKTDPFQVEVYAALIPVTLPPEIRKNIRHVSIALNELGKGYGDVVDCREITPQAIGSKEKATIGELDKALDEVNAWPEKYGPGPWPAQACKKCQYCTIPGCPVKDKSLEPLASIVPAKGLPLEIKTKVQAEEAVLFLQYADQAVKEVKDLVKAWVKVHGPVVKGGKVAEIRPETSWKVEDMAGLVRALIEAGLPWGALYTGLTMSRTNLEKLLKALGKTELKEKLMAAHGKEKEGSKFGLFKEQED